MTTADLFAENVGKPLPDTGRFLIVFDNGTDEYVVQTMRFWGVVPKFMLPVKYWLKVELP